MFLQWKLKSSVRAEAKGVDHSIDPPWEKSAAPLDRVAIVTATGSEGCIALGLSKANSKCETDVLGKKNALTLL